MTVRALGAIFLLLSVGYFGTVRMTELERLSRFPVESLRSEKQQVDSALAGHERDMTLPAGGMEELERMRARQRWLELELARRKLRADRYAAWMGVLGVLAIVLPSLGGLLRKPKKPGGPARGEKGAAVPELPPREEYVDEWEFRRKTEGGFKTREEAVEWLLKDPLLQCDYCGGNLRSTFTGNREALQLATFYKKVPEGARDLRVVLGSCWFAKAASELKCGSCQRVVRR